MKYQTIAAVALLLSRALIVGEAQVLRGITARQPDVNDENVLEVADEFGRRELGGYRYSRYSDESMDYGYGSGESYYSTFCSKERHFVLTRF